MLSFIFDRTFLEYLYLGSLLCCYFSFWYGSLNFFNHKTQTTKVHRVVLRLLTLFVWNFSYLAVLRGDSATGGRLILSLVFNTYALVLFWLTLFHVKNIHFAVIFDEMGPKNFHKSGPYKLIRHPFYSSYVFVYLGLVISQNSILLCATALFLVGYYFYAAKTEEKNFLSSIFASEYANYQSKTSMFGPFKLF